MNALRREREPQPTRGVPIALRSVVKNFGASRVLRGLSLDIAAGSFVAIIGRSGCGKSTLLRLLAGLEQSDAGSVRIDGEAPQATRDNVRVMFQEARLLPWQRVIDNVALGLPHEQRAIAVETLAQVGLATRAHEWPVVLSGGQKQRVALARALVHRPQLLLLDEPLGAVDALTRIEMQRLIEVLWLTHGFTAVLVTHDVSEAVALADRIVLIEDGTVALDLAVPLTRPHARSSAETAAIEARILQRLLGDETI